MEIVELRKTYFDCPFHTDSFVRNSIKQGLIADVLSMSRSEFDAWTNTFSGYVIRKKNGRLCLKHLKDILGFVPTFQDFTKANLRYIADELSKRVAPGTARLETSIIKSALNYFKDDVTLPYPHFADMLRPKSPKSDAIFLSEDEIERLSGIEPENYQQRYTKRIFLIMCYTGMRISDAKQADTTNIQTYDVTGNDGVTRKQDFFVYTSNKTKTKAPIPCGETLKKALAENEKYNDETQLFNSAIKELCKRAGIDETITLFRKGKYETLPKYMFVSAHTARRSFVTNLFLRGMDILTISKLAGHSGVEMTTRYIKAPKPIDDVFMDFFNK